MLAGHYADRWVGNETPWFTMLGILAGGFAGFNLLLRMIKKIDNGKDGQSD
jgi:F0F1-type ATP synthase assembly protein I